VATKADLRCGWKFLESFCANHSWWHQ